MNKNIPTWSDEGIFCVECKCNVSARLTNGEEIYPHRPDLYSLPFWLCEGCGNHVGCHHKTKDRTRPLGNIPTPALKNARKHIHAILDPIWRNGKRKRGEVYNYLSNKLKYEYHTAEIKDINEARKVYKLLLEYRRFL